MTLENVSHGAALGDVLVSYLDHAATAEHLVRSALQQVLQAREQRLGLERAVFRIGTAIVPGDGGLLRLDRATRGTPHEVLEERAYDA